MTTTNQEEEGELIDQVTGFSENINQAMERYSPILEDAGKVIPYVKPGHLFMAGASLLGIGAGFHMLAKKKERAMKIVNEPEVTRNNRDDNVTSPIA